MSLKCVSAAASGFLCCQEITHTPCKPIEMKLLLLDLQSNGKDINYQHIATRISKHVQRLLGIRKSLFSKMLACSNQLI